MAQRKHLFIILLLSTHFAFAQNHPIPGKLYDAGGHKLHLDIQGKGSPTVIFENGSGDFSFIWTLVQTEPSKYTQTVSYDRAGYAWSEPGPMPRTGKQICFELHTALGNAGIHPPYILVGQSFSRGGYRGYQTERFTKLRSVSVPRRRRRRDRSDRLSGVSSTARLAIVPAQS